MKPRVYIETSVISYLTAKPSADIIVSARQIITAQWWESERQHYELLISEVQEASMGNKTAAKLRLNALMDIPLLQADDKKADVLARALIRAKALPQSAWLDAQHIACTPS